MQMGSIEQLDECITGILHEADTGFKKLKFYSHGWPQTVYTVLRAHHVYKTEGRLPALQLLQDRMIGTDWEIAAIEWLQRRK